MTLVVAPSSYPSQSRPPIFKLNHDILWEIFSSLIAHLQDRDGKYEKRPSPLTTLRHLSQVCLIWRNLVLSFSSLWGMAFYLGELAQKTDFWRAELLRRAGKSLLNIQGHLNRLQGSEGLHKFILILLNDHWIRIRSLDIGFGSHHSFITEEEVRHTFQEPAPNLEYFSVTFVKPPDHFFSSQFGIFAGHSPILRHFDATDFHINPGASWLSNLRGLRLTCRFTVPELLDALRRMPFLEILDVYNEYYESDAPVLEESALPYVMLPQLTEISVDAEHAVTKYLTVLDHLGSGSLNIFSFLHNHVPFIPSHFEIAQRVLLDYLRRFYNSNCPPELSLLIGSRSFTVLAGSFTFGIDPLDHLPDPSIFLSSIKSIPFENIIRLTLNIADGTVSATNEAFVHIISMLTSLEVLEVNPYVLELLVFPPITIYNISFPSLKTLAFSVFDDLKPDFLFIFLAGRRRSNAQIEVLDLTPEVKYSSSWLKYHNFDFLEEFDGLKVIWGTPGKDNREYVCGAGNAKVLNFPANS